VEGGNVALASERAERGKKNKKGNTHWLKYGERTSTADARSGEIREKPILSSIRERHTREEAQSTRKREGGGGMKGVP